MIENIELERQREETHDQAPTDVAANPKKGTTLL